MRQYGFNDLRQISRLILLDPGPKAGYLRAFAHAYESSFDELAGDIREATRRAREVGIEVRWFDGPIVSMVIADPNEDTTWLRFEIAIPFMPAKLRVGARLSRRSHRRAYDTAFDSYQRTWEKSRVPTPEEYAMPA